MRWLCLLLLIGCRTQPLDNPGDGGRPPLPDMTPSFCGGFTGGVCPSGQFCEIEAGQCFNDSGGRCQPTPTACNRNFDPVCGCDFITYSNDCERQRAGQPLAFHGFCEGPPDLGVVDLARPLDFSTPFACGVGCGPGEYCLLGCCGAPGCTPPPPTCELLPQDCGGCDCFPPSSLCACTEDPATGAVTYQCFGCP